MLPTTPNVLVVGSFVMDLIVRTDRAPKAGETVIGTDFARVPGGKGANQAVAAARLGAKVAMVGRVGEDLFGDDQIENLQRCGVDTQYIVRDPEAPTGVGSITLEASGQNRIVVIPGANMRCVAQDLERAQAAWEWADVILLQCEIPQDVNAYALQKAAEANKCVVFNPAPARPMDDEHLTMATVITPNESEAEALTGVSITSVADAERAARTLLSRGARNVAITLGDQGVLYAGEGGEMHLPTWPVQVVDTTAAGDAFNGALAVGLGAGLEWPEALALANATGALAVTKLGAQPSMPSREEVETLLARRAS